MRITGLGPCLALPLWLIACGTSEQVTEPEPIDAVVISRDSITLGKTGQAVLKVEVLDASGQQIHGTQVTWTSSMPDVASVEPHGIVTGLSRGATSVIAEANGKADTAQVVVETGWSAIAASIGLKHTCGVTVDGLAYCWGANDRGQLGDNTTADRHSPTRIGDEALRFTDIVAGSLYSCALTDTRAIHCWGANHLGQIGNNTTDDQLTPTLVSSGVEYLDLSAGSEHTCARTSTALHCWGSNQTQQLGLLSVGTDDHAVAPIAVLESFAFSSVKAGVFHTCGLQAGVAYCWGANDFAQLGTGEESFSQHDPVTVAAPTPLESLGPALQHTCGIDGEATIYCWGLLFDSAAPVAPQLFADGDFDVVTSGWRHVCAISSSRVTTECWGVNAVGQVGDGTTSNRAIPTGVASVVAFIQVTTGHFHTCGIGLNRLAYCWGSNERGQLGNGTTADMQLLPEEVADPAKTAP